MENLRKLALRQRPWWPPDASFMLVIALSIVLGVWPLADPQWTRKGFYLLSVIAMLIVGSLISARDRWLLSSRHQQQYAGQLMGLRTRLWGATKDLAQLYKRYETQPQADLSTDFFEHSPAVLGLLTEIGQVGQLLLPSTLTSTLGNGVKSPRDVLVVIAGLRETDNMLGVIYAKTLGD